MLFNKSILLVDDDEDDRLFFTDVISDIDKDLICHSAADGRQAIYHLEMVPPPPDVIFLDLNMPVMNGMDMLKFIKTKNELKEIPVVIFTTTNSPAEIVRAKNYGAKMFFTKPSSLEVLRDRLQVILSSDLKTAPFLVIS